MHKIYTYRKEIITKQIDNRSHHINNKFQKYGGLINVEKDVKISVLIRHIFIDLVV